MIPWIPGQARNDKKRNPQYCKITHKLDNHPHSKHHLGHGKKIYHKLVCTHWVFSYKLCFISWNLDHCSCDDRIGAGSLGGKITPCPCFCFSFYPEILQWNPWEERGKTAHTGLVSLVYFIRCNHLYSDCWVLIKMALYFQPTLGFNLFCFCFHCSIVCGFCEGINLPPFYLSWLWPGIQGVTKLHYIF